MWVALGHTAFYTPSGNNNPGTWAAGPDIPGGLVATDAPGAMMYNGSILRVVTSTSSHNPVYFYEFDPVANTFTQAPSPTGGFTDGQTISDAMTMLILPSGNVMFSDTGSHLYVYQTDSGPLAAGQPAINSVSWNLDGSLHLSGTLFTASPKAPRLATTSRWTATTRWCGSPMPVATFPMAAASNWSSTGVQTGGTVVTTECAAACGRSKQSRNVL